MNMKSNAPKASDLKALRKKVKALRRSLGLSTKALALQLAVPRWQVELAQHDALLVTETGELEAFPLPLKEFQPLTDALNDQERLFNSQPVSGFESSSIPADEAVVVYLPITLDASSLTDELTHLIQVVREDAVHMRAVPQGTRMQLDFFMLQINLYCHCMARMQKTTQIMAAMQNLLHLLQEVQH